MPWLEWDFTVSASVSEDGEEAESEDMMSWSDHVFFSPLCRSAARRSPSSKLTEKESGDLGDGGQQNEVTSQR